jgi:hypothetical protein
MNYSKLSDKALLDALAQAGRKPEKELIAACLARKASLIPHLLDLVLMEGDEAWDADDPRWYTGVHAGRLLIAFREPAAIPIFVEILRDDEWENLSEWFQTDLHHYGPAILPPLVELLADERVEPLNRVSVVEVLTNIASRYPEVRQTVRFALRAVLPPLQADGTLAIDDEDLAEAEISFWTFVASGLGELGDKQSLPIVEALHKEDLIDEMVYGDFEEYKKEYFSPKGFRYHRRQKPYDIFRAYGYKD